MTELDSIALALVSAGIPKTDPSYAHGRWLKAPSGIIWNIEDWSDLSCAQDQGFTQSIALTDLAQDYGSRIDFCFDASGRLVQIELDRCCPRDEANGYEIPTVSLPIATTPAEAVHIICDLNLQAQRYLELFANS